MAAQLRAIRQRIRSIQSTAKITRAQELIASSRIIRAQQRVRDAAPYAREITQAVEVVVSRSAQIDHPIVREPERVERTAILILTSDRGFAGGYNANVLREAQGLRALLDDRGVGEVTYVSGRKGISWHRFREREVAAEWSGFSETPRSENAREITEALLDAFARPAAGAFPLYEFEPSPPDVLDALLPWYVESRIYHALLEAAASEIASRRRAMKSATDNANDLLDQFTLEANKARQAEITQEISEIVGGANALAEAAA